MAPHSTRRRSSGEGQRTWRRKSGCGSAQRSWPPCWSAARRRRRMSRSRGARRGAQGVVQGERPGGPGPAGPGRHAAPVHALCGEAAAEGCRGDDREDEPRVDQVARRRQVARATGRTASASRRRAAASSSPTIRRARSAAIATHATSFRRRKFRSGPSARRCYQFGKLRGYTDETRKYAYGKIWNADAYNACSNMPRFGHSQILSEQQIKDLVALLMDPDSPVNK